VLLSWDSAGLGKVCGCCAKILISQILGRKKMTQKNYCLISQYKGCWRYIKEGGNKKRKLSS